MAKIKRSFGWRPSLPDFRDYTRDHDHISPSKKAAGQTKSIKDMLQVLYPNVSTPYDDADAGAPTGLPTNIDLRQWCSPIADQGGCGSCCAHAGVGLLEFMENKAFGKFTPASRLFLYKTLRTLMHQTGDVGGELRTTMQALATFGVPPEEYWPYTDDPNAFDVEPGAFQYSFAGNFAALNYVRLDPSGIAPGILLDKIKTSLSTELPAMFGFTVYSSYSQSETKGGMFPFPTRGEQVVGGHALLAVGYSDSMEIVNTNAKGTITTGALLIRNSWGEGWGSNGYGYLPYQYVLAGLATDWWNLLKQEWLDESLFNAA